jgi:hypothetical protein
MSCTEMETQSYTAHLLEHATPKSQQRKYCSCADAQSAMQCPSHDLIGTRVMDADRLRLPADPLHEDNLLRHLLFAVDRLVLVTGSRDESKCLHVRSSGALDSKPCSSGTSFFRLQPQMPV